MLNIVKYRGAEIYNLNFHTLEVVSRCRDPQLQVGKNYFNLYKISYIIENVMLIYLANPLMEYKQKGFELINGAKKCRFQTRLIFLFFIKDK